MANRNRSRNAVAFGAALATLMAGVSHTLPAAAQSRTPEIAAKERNDPAAGEVIILNGGKSKATAPDPYAPIKLKPLPADRAAPAASATQSQGQSQGQSPGQSEGQSRDQSPAAPARPPQSAAAPAGTPSQAAPARVPTAAAPPLPALNTDRAPRQARLRDAPQSAPGAAQDDADGRNDRGRARSDDPARTLPRDPPRRRIARDDDEERNYRPRREPETYRRQFRDERPWGACRQFARRCQDGFEGACVRWHRACS